MVKRMALGLSAIGLCGVVFLFWYFQQRQDAIEISNLPDYEHAVGQEPITPIPLALNLDARKVALGRRLFRDPRLSHDNTLSCFHCHNLEKGGMDGLPRPVGLGGQEGKINTLTVFNSGFNPRLFWDGRAATLEDQLDFTIQNPSELGTTMAEIIGKLSQDEAYRHEFENIYHEDITPDNLKDTIATYERSLTTPNSKFDRYLRGDLHALDSDELAGYKLFKELGCISCHQGMNVGGNMFEKIGLVGDYFAYRGDVQAVDYGRYNATGREEDRYEFRVPALRNVALTAPYFHDASATTLEQAVAIMAKFQLGVTLPKDELGKIVKFLNTLTGDYRDETDK